MKNNPLKSQLLTYSPTNAEQTFKKTMLDFLSTSDHVFERSHCCGHITASCWLLDKERTHGLMMHHKKLDQWFQLGGHCDGDPDTLAVAIKEAQEESGINDIIALSPDIFDIDIHWIPSNTKELGHYHYDVRYLLAVNSDEKIVQNSESKELRWIPMTETPPTDNLSVLRMFHKCKKYLELP